MPRSTCWSCGGLRRRFVKKAPCAKPLLCVCVETLLLSTFDSLSGKAMSSTRSGSAAPFILPRARMARSTGSAPIRVATPARARLPWRRFVHDEGQFIYQQQKAATEDLMIER
jgi:hypothetical protein